MYDYLAGHELHPCFTWAHTNTKLTSNMNVRKAMVRNVSAHGRQLVDFNKLTDPFQVPSDFIGSTNKKSFISLFGVALVLKFKLRHNHYLLATSNNKTVGY